MSVERFENLDGLRAYSCIGIVLMHVLSNIHLGLTGYVYQCLIPSFTHLVLLFLLISAFSMCCGYYEKIKSNSIGLEDFYKRRYQRVWPFFALLCTIELLVEHSLPSLYEWFADLSLAFGLLPNADISVVGVGWFIGLIFAFYMVFPFFVFLIGNKKRAWFVFCVAVILNVLCRVYFFDEAHVNSSFVDRTNIIYVAVFLVSGGLLYLYRNEIKRSARVIRWINGGVLIGSVLLYFTVLPSIYTLLVLYSSITILAIIEEGHIAKLIFQNKVVRFISSISMETYLCHMFVFRFYERVVLSRLKLSGPIVYWLTAIVVIISAIVMAWVFKLLLGKIQKKQP